MATGVRWRVYLRYGRRRHDPLSLTRQATVVFATAAPTQRHQDPDWLRHGTCAAFATEVNLLLFQMLKSEPSVVPSPLKSPLSQFVPDWYWFEFQMLKSEPSTLPSPFASPGSARYVVSVRSVPVTS